MAAKQKNCSLCNTRRGKRSCPARQVTICTVCCANLRGKEIRCPADCPHLSESKRYSRKRMEPVRNSEITRRGERIAEVGQAAIELVFELDSRIQELTRSFPDLTDADIKESLENLKSTYETLDKGIIYTFSSPSPRVQALIRDLQKFVEEKQKALDAAGNRVYPLKHVLAALKEIQGSFDLISRKGKGCNPYREFLNSTFPPQEAIPQK